MKTKKLIIAILLFVAITVLFAFTNQIDAASSSGLGNLKITRERIAMENYVPEVPTSAGPYTVTYKHQLYTGNTSITKNVWKIVSANENTTEKLPDLYCLRAGLGFTFEGDVENDKNIVNYNLAYDMSYSKDYEQIKTFLSGLNSEVTIFEDKDSFNAVLWILDNMLLEKDMQYADKVKAYLMNYAGYESADFTDNPLSILSSADIEVIQQLAIWYFTNPESPEDTEVSEYPNYKAYHDRTLPFLYTMLSCEEEDFYNTYYETEVNNSDGTQTTVKNYKYVAYQDNNHPYNSEYYSSGIKKSSYGVARQSAAQKLYLALITNGEAAATVVKNDTTNKDGLYTPVNREITVYLAGGDDESGLEVAKQQPVVQVKEKEADIALRKFISKINNKELEVSREPKV
ncbi:MAG: thioester domain-containing protein, partial [Clostridia bacterium]|nr:thioester domain-containing protein [Clostridia bacterium]